MAKSVFIASSFWYSSPVANLLGKMLHIKNIKCFENKQGGT